MGNRVFSESSYLAFSCQRRIDYGQQITILVGPELLEGKWIAFVLDSKSRLIEIELDSNEVNGSNFIVMRHPASRGEFVAHYAIPVEHLERASKRIEDEVIHKLCGTRLATNEARLVSERDCIS